MEDRGGIWMMGGFDRSWISHRQRLVVQPILGKWIYESESEYQALVQRGDVWIWQGIFKVRSVPTWSWEGRDSELARLLLRFCSTLVASNRPLFPSQIGAILEVSSSPHWRTRCWCRTCRAPAGRWSRACNHSLLQLTISENLKWAPSHTSLLQCSWQTDIHPIWFTQCPKKSVQFNRPLDNILHKICRWRTRRIGLVP